MFIQENQFSFKQKIQFSFLTNQKSFSLPNNFLAVSYPDRVHENYNYILFLGLEKKKWKTSYYSKIM